jgi:glucosamine--fructose-6-phosphate aminotransferase (isomerizing)
MCGIFGIISSSKINKNHLLFLAKHARQRGKDSSGLCFLKDGAYNVIRANYDINKLLSNTTFSQSSIAFGHSRLITNGLFDNQPVVRDEIILIHNGIIVNDDDVWANLNQKREFEIDSEAIIGLAIEYLNKGNSIDELSNIIFDKCIGSISSAIAFPKLGKLCLLSNNGSLYYGFINNDFYFSSEYFPLSKLGCLEIKQILNDSIILDIPILDKINVSDNNLRSENLIPVFKNISSEENLLVYPKHNLKRCTKCILPETMPFIQFDDYGICNYCKNYKLRNKPKPKEELFKLIESYRRVSGAECIVPFSGGRDSCWGLHLIAKELDLKPITYTYDWGMVTDLGRRNISKMCSIMGVENIIIADDISLKRNNIARNLNAWLKSPNLGMISILTAGDKHFFRHVETVKKQTGIKLNLWGVNPLEVTHFKSGFLGVPPDFEEKKVYSNGVMKQLRYQSLRFKAMLDSPGYFNTSLWDTVSGEYYRSFTTKDDYFHIFDYWNWDENICNDTLKLYDWELAPDTNTTWRIGDGTAAFYNYLYYTIAGFTEHDTFRSNQIREGQLTRDEALLLVEDENRPRYQNIRWYLDALSMDFESVINRINSIEKLYKEIK